MKYDVLYTHQKQKKVKAWKDGFLTIDCHKKAKLFDEKNIPIDNTFVLQPVSAGDEIDFPRHLVQIDCVSSSEFQGNEKVESSTPEKPIQKYLPIKKASFKNAKLQDIQICDSALEQLTKSPQKRKLVTKPFIKHDLNLQFAPESSYKGGLNSEISPPKAIISSHNSGKQKVGFLCFASDASFQISYKTNFNPTYFDSFHEYKVYQANIIAAYIQSSLDDLFHKVKTRRYSSVSELSAKSDPVRTNEFILYSGDQIKMGQLNFNPSLSKNEKLPDLIDEKEKGCIFLTPGASTLTITLKDYSHSDFLKDDIWILSLSNSFPIASTILCRSVYHGVSGGKIQIAGLTSRDNFIMRELVPKFKLSKPIVIKGYNVGTELTILENIENCLLSTPLIDFLADPRKKVESASIDDEKQSDYDFFDFLKKISEEKKIEFELYVDDLVQKTCTKFQLNQDQSQALTEFSYRLFMDSSEPPVLLIHGVFGSGKSYLIAIMTIFVIEIASYFEEDISPPKILIASMTNTAVDNILQVLLKLNFNSFVRVGSLKRISKTILPYAIQSKKRVEDDIKELQSIIDGVDLSEEDKNIIELTIERFQSQDSAQSTDALLKRTSVVGATCLATSFPCLENKRYSIVILDEVSQITESLSLLPILKFDIKNLVLVGDPLQLPPTITSIDNNTILRKRLKFTLFDRLYESGVTTVMLKTQYRCHPSISSLSNKMFYNQSLENGINDEDRAPVIEGLPALCFIDISTGKEVRQYGKQSLHNVDETDFIVNIIQGLLQNNIPLNEIGVISMYKLQAEKIESQLMLSSLVSQRGRKQKKAPNGIRISTVDAFQGAEMEIIIVSCVKSSYSTTQFLNNPNRINVALTRGRRHLFLVGNALLLKQHSYWKDIIELHCKNSPNGFMNDEAFLSLLSPGNFHPKNNTDRTIPKKAKSTCFRSPLIVSEKKLSPSDDNAAFLSKASLKQGNTTSKCSKIQSDRDIEAFISDVEDQFVDSLGNSPNSNQASSESYVSNEETGEEFETQSDNSVRLKNTNTSQSFKTNSPEQSQEEALSENNFLNNSDLEEFDVDSHAKTVPEKEYTYSPDSNRPDTDADFQPDIGFLDMLNEIRKKPKY